MPELKAIYRFESQGLSAVETKDMIAQSLSHDSELLEEIKRDIETGDYPVPWRAAWILDSYFASNPKATERHLKWIKDQYVIHESEGVLRILGKIIGQFPFEKTDGPVVDRAIQLMDDRATAIAVRVHAMQIVFMAGLVYPELHGELLRSFDLFEQDDPSAGLRVRMRDIRTAIAKLQIP
jgi:hypothetical protein